MDADTDSDYNSDSRDDLFDGVDPNRAFDNITTSTCMSRAANQPCSTS